MNSINIPKLREQRDELVEITMDETLRKQLTEKGIDIEKLDGVINFFDDLLDAAELPHKRLTKTVHFKH